MSASSSSPTPTPSSYKNAPTRSVSVQGVSFAYRQLGPDDGVPLILLNHLSAVLDNWDPRVVDGLAARRRVITYDNRGVGASGGSTPDTIEAMARDTVLFIRALGFDQVDLLGLSMGGFIAQVIAAEEPDLVRKLILAGTGPAGGPGIDKVTSLTVQDMLKATLRRKDPKHYLFFITCLPTAERRLYLACWLDLATREVVGYAMADHHRAELVVDAPDMAHGRGGLEPGCVIHSDRGSECTSAPFRARIGKLGLRHSCGRTGSCFDNAAAESFWTLHKEEVGTRIRPDRATARAEVFSFIATFYNHRRPRKHRTFGYLTPTETRQRHRHALAA
ncbi:alpha/beta fold hydrolase [Streptomyces hebeiensis]